MKLRKTAASGQNLSGSNLKPGTRKLRPDPDGLIKRAAGRAGKIIAAYDLLNGEVEEDELITNLLFDLICLTERKCELGDMSDGFATAIHNYEKVVAENEWIVGTPDYDSRKGRSKGTPPPFSAR